MKYNPPIGATEQNAAYLDGQPGVQKGSAVPAAAIEQPQREIVRVIEAAGLEPDGENLGQLHEAIELLSGKTGAMPILSILWDLSSVAKPGFLDAAKYHGLLPRSAFPQAAEEIQRRFAEGDSAVVADSDWQAELEANGVCPKFSIGDGANNFRIPYLPGLYPGAPREGQVAGDYLGDAIRNITGEFTSTNGTGCTKNAPLSGIFKQGTRYTNWLQGVAGMESWAVAVDLEGQVPTAEVNRPNTAVMTPLIKMYGTVVEEGEADIAKLIELIGELNGRLERRLPDFTILYPGGTEENPATIGKETRLLVDNPFPGSKVLVLAQVQIEEQWGHSGHYTARNLDSIVSTYFVEASLIGDDIIVQSGTNGPATLGVHSGNGFGTTTAIQTALPFRVLVWKLGN